MESITKSISLTASNAALTLDVEGFTQAGIDVRGTFTATLVAEGTIDGSNWFTLGFVPVPAGINATSITAAGQWLVQIAGLLKMRIRVSAYTSGSAQVLIRAVGGVSDYKPISTMVKANFTRPSDTTAYAAGDAVTDSTSAPTIMTFDACARANAGSGVITHAVFQDSANQSTKGSFELWLFHTTVTPDNDNAVFTPTDAENRTFVGVIPFTLPYVGDATSGANGNAVYMGTVDRPLPFVCDSGDDNLYGLLVVRSAYTPVSAERFDVTLFIDQN